MKKHIIIIGLLVLLLGCEKSVKTCNFNDPLKDLPWLQELKTSFTNCSCEMSIIQATYNKQTVFYSAMTDPICNGSCTWTPAFAEATAVKARIYPQLKFCTVINF